MTKKTTTHEVENSLIDWLESIFTALPPLSKSFVHAVVDIMPWLALIFGVIGVMTTIAGLGLSTIFLPVVLIENGLGGALGRTFNLIVSLVASILFVVAVPHLKKRHYLGWRMIFWSEVINGVSAILAGSVSAFAFACVAMYFLFQIKSAYK